MQIFKEVMKAVMKDKRGLFSLWKVLRLNTLCIYFERNDVMMICSGLHESPRVLFK